MEWVLLCVMVYILTLLIILLGPLVWSHSRKQRIKPATLDNAEIVKALRKLQNKKEGK